MSQDLIAQGLYALVAAGAVYGGIRADIKAMHERISAAQRAANEAHRRLDTIIDRRAK